MKKRIVFATLFLGIMFSFSVGIGAADVSNSWGPSHEDGAIFEWTINELEDENGSTSWTWDLLGLTLTEGDIITFEWTSFNDSLLEVTLDTASTGIPFEDYSSATIKVGTTTLDENQSIAMRMLVLPVYVDFGGGVFSGFSAMEGYWWSSYVFPNAVDSFTDWNLDVIKATADLDVIGENASSKAVVEGYIFCVTPPLLINGSYDPNYLEEEEMNVHVFDIEYDAAEGYMKSLQFPCTIEQTEGTGDYPGPYPAVGNNATYLSDGLKKLDITLTSPSDEAPGFELIIALGSFATIALIISRKRK